MEFNRYKIEPEANHTRANLERADLTRANLYSADLYKADLKGALPDYPVAPLRYFGATIRPGYKSSCPSQLFNDG